MKLRAILPPDATIETGSPDLDVRGVAADSRAVKSRATSSSQSKAAKPTA